MLLSHFMRTYDESCAHLHEQPFTSNERFKVVKSSKGSFDELTGLVTFGRAMAPDKKYRTLFCPFYCDGRVWRLDNDSISLATRRLTNCADPPYLTFAMRNNQFAFDEKYRDEILHLESFRREILSTEIQHLTDPENERLLWAIAPHPKRSLRVNAIDSLIATAWSTFTGTPTVQFKQKPDELLAPNKYPRGIGDLSVVGSAKLGYYMDSVKNSFKPTYLHGGISTRFIKCATYSDTLAAFEEIIHGTDEVSLVYHSDDACLGANCVEGRVYWNIDISQCDGSHHDPTFDSLYRIMSVESRFQADIDGCFAQTLLPLRIRSEDNRQSVTLQPLFRTLYSGSVLTTAANNTAIERAGVALRVLLKKHARKPTAVELQSIVIAAFADAGYRVKIDVCACIEDLQFLKRSPCMCEGRIVHFLNLGVWLRGFGQCYGDIPGGSNISLHQRAMDYMSGVVESHIHDGDHVISDAFRHRFPRTRSTCVVTDRFYGVENHDGRVSDESICARYRCTHAELYELADTIRGLEFGVIHRSPLTDSIFRKDYGY